MHRFHNKNLVAVFLGFNVSKLVFKVCHLRGQNPGLREKIIVILEDFLHSRQVSAEVIFPRKLVHAGKVVDPLVVLKLRKLVWENSLSIIPKDVPISVLIISKLVA